MRFLKKTPGQFDDPDNRGFEVPIFNAAEQWANPNGRGSLVLPGLTCWLGSPGVNDKAGQHSLSGPALPGVGALGAFTFDGSTQYADVANGSDQGLAFTTKGYFGFWSTLSALPTAVAATNKHVLSHTNTTQTRLVVLTSFDSPCVLRLTTTNGANTTITSCGYTEANDLQSHWHEIFIDCSQSTDSGKVQIFKDYIQKTLTFTLPVPSSLPALPGIVPVFGAGANRASLFYQGNIGPFFCMTGRHPSLQERQRIAGLA